MIKKKKKKKKKKEEKEKEKDEKERRRMGKIKRKCSACVKVGGPYGRCEIIIKNVRKILFK